MSRGAVVVDEIVWLSSARAAAYLGVATVTLHRMVDRGSVPAYKISRMIRFKLSDLETYIDSVRVAPAFAARTAPPHRRASRPKERQDPLDVSEFTHLADPYD